MNARDRDCSTPSGHADENKDHHDFRYRITGRVAGGRRLLRAKDPNGEDLAREVNASWAIGRLRASEAFDPSVGRAMTHFAFARILIVDDSPGWRARVREILAAHPEWKIISEASDGQEAVRDACELQPDVIVLDIAMPRLNGIEAAKMIRQKSPKSRIVFLTVDNDSDIMKAALDVGQTTYVTKDKAATRLCEAVAASLGET